MHRNIIPGTKTIRTINSTAAGVTTINGNVVNHDGARSVVHKVFLGAVVDGTVSSVKVQEGTLADGSDMADVAGLTYTIKDADDNNCVQLELYKPLKQYSRIVVVRTTQNVTIDGAEAVLFHNRTDPQTQDATCVGNVTVLG